MKRFEVKVSRRRFQIYGYVQELGEDLLVSIWGGTRPHIGAVGAATPRPSLKDPGKWSATSSNLTFLGHKEDLLAKKISEQLATLLRRNVVVVMGIHWDHMTSKEIKMVESLSKKIPNEILKKIHLSTSSSSRRKK